MKPFLLAAVASALVAAPAAAGEDNDGSVRVKPRSCTPAHTKVVERRKGVVFSRSRDFVFYACATWIGHSYNMLGPIYKEQFAENDGSCDLGGGVAFGPVRGERVRYRLICSFSFGTEGSGTIRWRCRLNLRTGVIRYRELPKRR